MKILRFLLLGVSLTIGACSEEIPAGCIDESKIMNSPCPGNNDYVCGCDSKTYHNPCKAEISGVTSYTKGKCD